MRQDGIWVLATNDKFEAQFSGTRMGNIIKFELEPTTITGFHSIIGEWKITSDGSNLKGSWKVAEGTGFQDATGKWELTRIDDLSSGEDASSWSNEYFLSELVLVDSKGNSEPYTDIVGTLPVADSGQQDIPSKAEKIKSLPNNLAWLEQYGTNQNGKIDKNEMCHAWLIKLAELKTKNTFSPEQLRIVSQSEASSQKAFCIPLVQRKAVYAQVEQVLKSETSDDAIVQASKSLVDHFSPTISSGREGSGDGGGGDGGDGWGYVDLSNSPYLIQWFKQLFNDCYGSDPTADAGDFRVYYSVSKPSIICGRKSV